MDRISVEVLNQKHFDVFYNFYTHKERISTPKDKHENSLIKLLRNFSVINVLDSPIRFQSIDLK